MTTRLFPFVFAVITAMAVSTWAQVQQPIATTQPRVASKKIPFYSAEIFGAKYSTNTIMLEHPSKPESMRRQVRLSPIVRVAEVGGDEIPTKHLFDDSDVTVNRKSTPKNNVPAQGTSEDSITPITKEEAAQSKAIEPIPDPTDPSLQTANSVERVETVQPVVINEPVIVSNVGSTVTVTTNSVEGPFQSLQTETGTTDAFIDVEIRSDPNAAIPMGPGCSS